MSAARKPAKGKGKGKHRTRPAPKRDTTEAAIIGGCVRYMAAIAGASACFHADSTGDSIYAAAVSGKLMDEASAILATIARKPATTAAAIKAKARAAVTLVDTAQHGVMNETSGMQYAFLRVFLREVAEFVTPQANAAWREGKRAKRA